MSTYQKLDAQIIESIMAGEHPLYSRIVTEAKRIAEATGREEFRVVDGRLTALRKAGKIAADRKAPAGWVVVKEPQQ